ncbi:MAG: hypothetical protein UIM27_08775 [Acutalibacteraceae bacterium]|nr:hypothetical protein [Acutalibacteraceae bacterium]
MYLCPVCGKEIENTICSACGFDKSCDFENYPTLSEVSSQALGISNLKKTYENKQKKYISCKNCGGKSFYIDQETHECICLNCSEPLKGKFYKTPKMSGMFDEDFVKEYQEDTDNFNVFDAVYEARKLIKSSSNQNYEVKLNTAKKIKSLFNRFSFNKELAVKYAEALKCLSFCEESYKKNETVSELGKLYEQFKYSDEIALQYAESLSSMSITQDFAGKQDSVNKLKSLSSLFTDTENIAFFYAKALQNLVREQNIEERLKTFSELKQLYERFETCEEIGKIYALTICNVCKYQRKTNLTYSVGTGLFPKKESIDAKTILKNLSSKFPQNRSIRQCTEEINEMSRY